MSGVDELDAVAEGVVDVGAEWARELVGPADGMADGGESLGQLGQRSDAERGVGLAGRPEVVLDAEVHLHRTAANQHPPREANGSGLGSWVKPSRPQ